MRKVKAISLVSLIIGIGLGTFMIIVMLQVFGATRSNYKLAQNLAELNSVLRYAEVTMTDIIRQAGYRAPDATTGELPSYTTIFQPFNSTLYGPSGSAYDTVNYPNSDDPAGVVVSYFPGENVFISEIDANNYDKLWVKFEGDPDGSIRDCNDLYGVDDEVIKIRFYSRQTSIASGGTQMAYYCERQNDNEDYVYSDNPVGTVLIPADMFDTAWVRYGEDLTGNGFIDRWSLGDDVRDRNQVYAVRVAFLIHTKEDVRSENVTQSFEIFGQPVSRTDKKIYKLHTFTIPLPNTPNYPFDSPVGTP